MITAVPCASKVDGNRHLDSLNTGYKSTLDRSLSKYHLELSGRSWSNAQIDWVGHMNSRSIALAITGSRRQNDSLMH